MAGDGARDGGYALVAAMAAVAAFAYIAFEVMAADRGQIVGAGARVEQARLEAAADAGMMLAIHALGDADPSHRWPIDGRIEQADFDGTALAVSVQDERGKAPLDGLNPSQSRALFEAAGASGPRLDALVDELRDFQSGGDQLVSDTTGPPGAFPPAREGGFRVVGDLMALKDMNAALFERIAPAVTVFFEESGAFVPENAGPLARAVMAAEEDAAPAQAGPDVASEDREPVEADVNLVGRTLTVRAVARGRRGALAHRMAIVELTGAPEDPYWIRYVE